MSDYQSQRLLAYLRDKGRCVRDPSHEGEQMHHRQGRRGLDPHRLPNLLTLCSACHTYVHANPRESYENGWMVRRLGIATPECTPVRTPTGWLTLLSDGTTSRMKETA